MKLEKDKQPPYGSIYSQRLVELDILKSYIETHLKIEFILPSKFPVRALTLFDIKSNGNFCLCVNY